MDALAYQIVVQWSPNKKRFEAYSPTLVNHANKFVPDFPKLAYGESIVEAIENYKTQSSKFLQLLKSLAILPPTPDVGNVVLDYETCDVSLGKMVL